MSFNELWVVFQREKSQVNQNKYKMCLWKTMYPQIFDDSGIKYRKIESVLDFRALGEAECTSLLQFLRQIKDSVFNIAYMYRKGNAL